MIQLPVPFEKIALYLEEVQPGDWFMPVLYKDRDQHLDIPTALERGAAGFFYLNENCPKEFLGHPNSIPLKNLRETCFAWAEEKRRGVGFPIAVVTGSMGKTSVKEMVGAILKSWDGFQHRVHVTKENQNTKLQLSAQVLKLPRDSVAAMFEVGARRVGDFDIPKSILQPNIVCLLNTASAHLGEFGSLENLRRTKLSILDCKSAEVFVVPEDDSGILELAHRQGKRVVTFGNSERANLQWLESGGAFKLQFHGGVIDLPCTREVEAKNWAAASAIALEFGVPLDCLRKGMNAYQAPTGRYETRTWQGKKIVDDAYNASPESMIAGLSAFADEKFSGRKVLVLGSMLELGSHAEKLHRDVAEHILKAFGSDLGTILLTVGEEARWMVPERGFEGRHFAFERALDAEEWLRKSADEWDCLYLKGSKSIGLRGLLAK